MAIGSYGEVVFQVSASQIRTPRDWRERHQARHAVVEVLEGKPAAQFLGDGLSEVSFSMDFLPQFCTPEDEISTLKAIKSDGQPRTLQVGGYPVGDGPFVLLDFEVQRKDMDNQGKILNATVSVRLQERRE